jgi:hypothetical protein
MVMPTNEECLFKETLKTYNVVSYKVGDEINGLTTDNLNIVVKNNTIHLLNDDDTFTDIGTFFYSAQPVIKFDTIKTNCKVNKTAEKVNTKLTVKQNNNTRNLDLKSNCIYYVVDNQLVFQDNIVLSDVNSNFIYDDNVLSPEGYKYCYSLSTSTDKRFGRGFGLLNNGGLK